MVDVFISYSHKDFPVAKQIDDWLTSMGLSVWCDDRIAPGAKFEGDIQNKLGRARICLFLISQAFLDSEYCQNEVGFAEARDLLFLPCKIEKCNPKGFLSTRNQIDYTSKIDELDLFIRVRDLIAENEQNDLREELIEFHERQITVATELGENADYGMKMLEEVHGSGDMLNEEGEQLGWSGHYVRYREKKISFCLSEFKSANKLILEYLNSGRPVRDYLPISARWCRKYLPAWSLYSPSVSTIDKKTVFKVVPIALLDRDNMFEQGDVIEALVHFAQAEDFFESRHFLHEIIPQLTYWTANTNAPHDIGWTNAIGDKSRYLYIISKGIYRIGVSSSSPNGVKVSFTRYIGIEATRAKLWDISHYTERISPSSTVLQLMYVGFYKNMFGGGEMHFFLYNKRDSIAIVQGMKVIIHRVTPRKPEPYPDEELAALMEYKYQVNLKPSDEEVIVTKDAFKYSSGEIDKFVIEFCSSDSGYNYEVSVLVDWFDVGTGRTAKIQTPVEQVIFPLFL